LAAFAVKVVDMTTPTSTGTTTEIPDRTGAVSLDGAHAFDFYAGRWIVHNRKLVNMLDPVCDEWIEFDAVSDCWITLGGLGNFDTFDVADMPGVGVFKGMTMRLYDPEREVWKIWGRRPAGLGASIRRWRVASSTAGASSSVRTSSTVCPSSCGSSGRTSRGAPPAGSRSSRSTAARLG
jgi:hypothetical protein